MKNIYVFIKTFALVLNIVIRNQNDENVGSPIIISKDNKIIDGHTRYHIAKGLGIKQIPVIRLETEIEYIDTDKIFPTY